MFRFNHHPARWLTTALWLAAATMAYGQGTQGTILGTVTDSTGAVVPKAQVTIKNEGTNISRSMATDENGDYRIAGLEPGNYEVALTQQGFKTARQTKVDLATSQIKRVNMVLEVGEVATTVTVEGGTSQVETETVTLSNLKTTKDFIELPMSIYGRGYANVLVVAAGVHYPSCCDFVINGARGSGINLTTDGSSVISPVYSAQPANGFSAGIEVLREVKVVTANSSAEFSQVSQFIGVTKSGENSPHGSLYWGNYNSRFSARGWNDPSKPSFENHNMFDLTNGGPVYIPKLYDGRNKTFYFFAYSGARYRTGNRQRMTLPTPAFRQGDFGALAGQIDIVDPLTGLPFADNRIPQERLSPVSQAVQNLLYPDPNQPGAGDFGLTSNYYVDPGYQFNADGYNIRIDQKLADSNFLFARVGLTKTNQDIVRGGLKDGFGDGNSNGNHPSRNVVISDTHSFSANVVNEAKVAFTRDSLLYSDYNYGVDVLSQIGLQGIDNPGGDPAISGMPGFSFGGMIPFNGNSGWATLRQGVNTYEVIDNLSWYQSRHSFKMGFVGRRYQINDEYKELTVRGSFFFDDQLSGLSYANFLLGYPSFAQRSLPRPNAYPRSSTFGFYFQDDFKVGPRITLNYGVRYDYQTPWVEKFDRMYGFDPKTGNLVTAGTSVPTDLVPALAASLPIVPASEAGFPVRSLMHRDANNWGPRIGIAYRPFGDANTVVRMGYGLYTQIWRGEIALGSTGGPWQSNQSFFIEGNVPSIQFPNPFLTTSEFAGLQDITGFSTRFPVERSHQWNFSIGRQIWGTAVDIGYVGTKALNIPYGENLNLLPPSTIPYDSARRPYQDFNNAVLRQTGGSSIYHGLNIQADRRLTQGLSFNANYTWAKSLSDVGLTGFADQPQQNQYQRSLERADDWFIRRQTLKFSYIYQLPIGRGSRVLNGIPRALDLVIGGWQVAGITTMMTGQRLSPGFSGIDPANTNQFGGRPDRIGDGNFDSGGMRDSIKGGRPIFDSGAFLEPGAGRGSYGNSARYLLTGPGQAVWNIVVAKNFPFRESARVQFRWEMFNAFNRGNFGNPSTNISGGDFGIVTYTAGSSRRMLFALRLDY